MIPPPAAPASLAPLKPLRPLRPGQTAQSVASDPAPGLQPLVPLQPAGPSPAGVYAAPFGGEGPPAPHRPAPVPVAQPSPSPARADRVVVQPQPEPPISADDAHEPARLSSANGEATWEMALVLELAEPPPKPALTPEEMAALQRKAKARCIAPFLQTLGAVLAVLLVGFSCGCIAVGTGLQVSAYRNLMPTALVAGLIVSGTLGMLSGLLGLVSSACLARRVGLLLFYLSSLLLLLMAATGIALVLWLGAAYVADAVDALVAVTVHATGCSGGTLDPREDDADFSECVLTAAEAIVYGVNGTDTATADVCGCIDRIVAYVPSVLYAVKLVSVALVAVLALATILTASLVKAAQKARPPGETLARKRAASEHSEALLRNGLQLREGSTSAEEEVTGKSNPGFDGDASRSDTGWLIGELVRRIGEAGLAVKVLKLVPGGRDDLPDVEGEREIDSGYEVTMIVVGYYDGGQRLRRHAATTAEVESCFDAERVCAEAERLGLKLRCKESVAVRKGGRAAYARFTAARRAWFEPFPSALRQQLLRVILEGKALDRNSATNGAGLDLASLQASGRLLQTMWLHQDDETDALLSTQLRGRGGCLPKPMSELRAMHDYLGSELTYYFAWAAYYTRLLWWPGLLGVLFWAVDWFYLESLAYPESALVAGLERFNNASYDLGSGADYYFETSALTLTNLTATELQDLKRMVFAEPAEGDAQFYGRARHATVASFALALLVWAALFLEGWKRRATFLALDWGALDNALATVAREHVKFHQEALKKGFYTPDGLWVDLDGVGPAKPPPSADSGPVRPRPRARKQWTPSAEDAALLGDTPSVRWASTSRRLRRYLISLAVIVLMGSTCVLTILAIMLLRLVLAERAPDYTWGASIINALAIEVFNGLWRHIALALNSWENHRLDKAFRDALVYKMFGFQFINCYFTYFYLAFFRRHVGGLFGFSDSCGGGFECMALLRTQLQVTLVLNIVLGAFLEMSRPVRKSGVKKLNGCINNLRKRRKGSVTPGGESEAELDKRLRSDIADKVKNHKPLTPAEQAKYAEDQLVFDVCAQFERVELKAVEYGLSPTFYEFNELAIQFGYVIMFSAAWPAATFLALLNNLAEIRLDSIKILKITRRVPATAQATGIGAWRQVLLFLLYLGLATNLLILAYTSDMFGRYYPSVTPLELFVIVVVLEHMLIGMKLVIDYVIPDVPASVRIEMAREEWLADRRIHAEYGRGSADITPSGRTSTASEGGVRGWKPVSTRPSATAVLAPATAPAAHYVPLAPAGSNAPLATQQAPYVAR